MGHLEPRMAHPASQLWIFGKDCFIMAMKGAKKDMEILLVAF